MNSDGSCRYCPQNYILIIIILSSGLGGGWICFLAKDKLVSLLFFASLFTYIFLFGLNQLLLNMCYKRKIFFYQDKIVITKPTWLKTDLVVRFSEVKEAWKRQNKDVILKLGNSKIIFHYKWLPMTSESEILYEKFLENVNASGEK